MLWNIAVNDAGADYDPLTLLRTRTMFGRPDWMSVYGKVKQAIENGQYIQGSNAQLKTKVAVSNLTLLSPSVVLMFVFRHISADLASLRKLLRRPAFITQMQKLNFHLLRFVTFQNTIFIA